MYSDGKSSYWWWNEQVRWLNVIIRTTILTPSIARAATWCFNYPLVS
jgi:hypothetical protein